MLVKLIIYKNLKFYILKFVLEFKGMPIVQSNGGLENSCGK